MRVFVDTNVLLDVLGQREPFFAASAYVCSLAERGQMEAFVSAISFNNIFFVVRRIDDRDRAMHAVRWLRDLFSVVPLSGQILNQAIDADMSDFEDAIQFFSAIHVDAQILLTRNVTDFPEDSIPALTPAEFLATDWPNDT